jgi:hypothetical protein
LTSRRFNRVMSSQLAALRREGLIDAELHATLADRYRYDGWNWLSLGRGLLVFGSVSAGAGLYLLGRELLEFTLQRAAVGLAVLIAAAFAAAYHARQRGLGWTRRVLELLGGLLAIGLTFVLGLLYSNGPGNWPELLLIDLVVLGGLTYALNNVLLLVLSLVVFFTWFGGVTGYVSEWGSYWFGMNYPLRFLLAGLAIAGVGLVHRLSESRPLARYRGFFKVWLSSGIFFAEMALWLMSLFGNFGEIGRSHRGGVGELWFFNLLWTAGNGLLLYAGGHYGLRMLRGYAVTFLIIQAYTVFFRWIAGALGPVFSAFIAGGVTLALVIHLEKRRRRSRRRGVARQEERR